MLTRANTMTQKPGARAGAGEGPDGPEGPDDAHAGDAAALDELYELIAPDLETWAQAVRAAEPSLPDPEVLDRALRRALAHFRHDAGQQTLTYLQWRTEQATASAQATVAASVAARQARAEMRSGATTPAPTTPPTVADAERALPLADERPRTFRDGVGCVWSVHEVSAGAVPWAHGTRCLLFGSEAAIRRVWHFPAEWRTLSDAQLEALSWGV
jgi:hypothetical protein